MYASQLTLFPTKNPSPPLFSSRSFTRPAKCLFDLVSSNSFRRAAFKGKQDIDHELTKNLKCKYHCNYMKYKYTKWNNIKYKYLKYKYIKHMHMKCTYMKNKNIKYNTQT